MKQFVAAVALAVLGGCESRAAPLPPGFVRPPTAPSGARADFSCVGTGDTFTGDGPIDLALWAGREGIKDDPQPEPGVTISQVDPITGALIGQASAPTDRDGVTTLRLESNTKVALELTSNDPTLARTYYFNNVIPKRPGAVPDGPYRVVPIDFRDGLVALLGIDPDTMLGMGHLAGKVFDCNRDPVENAVIRVHGTEPAALGYFRGKDLPTPSSDRTDSSGRFVVVGAPPTIGALVEVEALVYDGPDSSGTPTTAVANAAVRFVAGQISIAVARPEL